MSKRQAWMVLIGIRQGGGAEYPAPQSTFPAMKIEVSVPDQKLRLAFELFDAGVSLMRQKLRRQHPEVPTERIDQLLAEWLSTRPGAEHGDAVGRLRKLSEPAA